jgi:MYND finger
MVKAKKSKKKPTVTTTSTTATISGSYSLHRDENGTLNPSSPITSANSTTAASVSSSANAAHPNNSASKKVGKKKENLDDLNWLRECELRQTITGEPYLQLEYQEDDELIVLLHKFLEESSASTDIIDAIYQIWQQTVLSTLLQSSAVWKKDTVTAADQRYMKDTLKTARYKINFILHHVTGSILTATAKKWVAVRESVLNMCYNTLQLVPRLAESCPHHATDIRLAIIHFEGKEFLAVVACETWDALYDFAVPIDPSRFIPVLRRCAMLDILDKDWNMLGGWEDILKGLEAKCCAGKNITVHRLQSDAVLHETTTVLRNARNSMQCKFFSVRFMRYTEDQAPQRWRYFPKCSAPACASIETADHPHRYRCIKCWYFHYCSASCQEYCDNIMGLHPKFCKDTPASKAALCQKETEQYLGWTTGMSHAHMNAAGGGAGVSDATGNDGMNNPMLYRVSCHACGTLEDYPDPMTAAATANSNSTTAPSSSLDLSVIATPATTKIKRCIQCQTVAYCSRQCQEWDWRVGGHREVCKALNGGSGEGGSKRNASHSTNTASTATSTTHATSDHDTTNANLVVKDLN